MTPIRCPPGSAKSKSARARHSSSNRTVAGTPFLEAPLRTVNGVGPQRERAFATPGWSRVGDLLSRLPFRYEDRSAFHAVAEVREGETVTVSRRADQLPASVDRAARVQALRSGGSRRVRQPRSPCGPTSPTGRTRCTRTSASSCTGRSSAFPRRPAVEQSRCRDPVDDEEAEPAHSGRIVPVYEKIGPVTGRMQRPLVHEVLEKMPAQVDDLLARGLRARLGLPDRATSLREAHFPPAGTTTVRCSPRSASPAQSRLIFEEFFLFQSGIAAHRAAADRESASRSSRSSTTGSERRLGPCSVQLTPGQASALRGDRRIHERSAGR